MGDPKRTYLELTEFFSTHKRELFERIVRNRTRHITVVLEDIHHPHNASAVLRTAELLGVQDVHIIEERYAYQVNPDIVLGSTKWLHLVRHQVGHGQGRRACLAALRQQGYRIVATSPNAQGNTPGTIPLEQPLAFCFGSEADGLSPEIMAQADITMHIPMVGFTESYNISVAAAITLYTVIQRLHNSDIPWQLDQHQQDELLLAWARQAVKHADRIEKELVRRRPPDEPGRPAGTGPGPSLHGPAHA